MISFTMANLLLNRPNNYVDASIISREQVRTLISLLENTIANNIPGDIVEFGCYVGESSKYLRMMMDYHSSHKRLYVYDSFEGLPPLSSYEENTGWRPGTLQTTEEVLLQNFINNGLRPPIIYKGWFNSVPKEAVPSQISFAFLDGDFYDSIHDSLSIVYPLVSRGGIICFHDYERPDLPGVKAAVDNYLRDNNIPVNAYLQFKIFHELGVLIKC